MLPSLQWNPRDSENPHPIQPGCPSISSEGEPGSWRSHLPPCSACLPLVMPARTCQLCANCSKMNAIRWSIRAQVLCWFSNPGHAGIRHLLSSDEMNELWSPRRGSFGDPSDHWEVHLPGLPGPGPRPHPDYGSFKTPSPPTQGWHGKTPIMYCSVKKQKVKQWVWYDYCWKHKGKCISKG